MLTTRRVFSIYRGRHHNRLGPKVVVNHRLTEAVVLPGSVNHFLKIKKMKAHQRAHFGAHWRARLLRTAPPPPPLPPRVPPPPDPASPRRGTIGGGERGLPVNRRRWIRRPRAVPPPEPAVGAASPLRSPAGAHGTPSPSLAGAHGPPLTRACLLRAPPEHADPHHRALATM